ncbi:MAG: hypothetical protein E7555_09450 [Ruminococcaceae bacterium]|nr:hypothetical protein [Oscillospiraceae bacterium]
MSINRTRQYFETTTSYRAKLRKIWEDYDKTLQRLEPYKGSNGYNEDVQEAENKRKKDISSLQVEYCNKFNEILQGMRKSATNQPIIPPTTEQLTILQTLKMRNKVSRDELKQAAQTLKNCPLCLSVLDEIAQDNEYQGVHFGKESTSAIIKHIETLSNSAKRICALDKPDSKKEQAEKASIYNPEHTHNALFSFSVDKDMTSESEAMSFLGGVTDFETFQEAVNGI